MRVKKRKFWETDFYTSQDQPPPEFFPKLAFQKDGSKKKTGQIQFLKNQYPEMSIEVLTRKFYEHEKNINSTINALEEQRKFRNPQNCRNQSLENYQNRNEPNFGAAPEDYIDLGYHLDKKSYYQNPFSSQRNVTNMRGGKGIEENPFQKNRSGKNKKKFKPITKNDLEGLRYSDRISWKIIDEKVACIAKDAVEASNHVSSKEDLCSLMHQISRETAKTVGDYCEEKMHILESKKEVLSRALIVSTKRYEEGSKKNGILEKRLEELIKENEILKNQNRELLREKELQNQDNNFGDGGGGRRSNREGDNGPSNGYGSSFYDRRVYQ